MKFDFNLPVNLLFGNGRTAEAGAVVSSWGKKALLVTGGNSARKSGLLDRVQEQLRLSGVESLVFDKVTPNPTTTIAYAGAKKAEENGCDVVVAVGGGSIIDCAKAVAFIVKNDGDIMDYIFGLRSGTQALPLIAIPTTCGTGSEGNGFAVLTNPSNGDKKSLRCNAIIPKTSIIDPECMMTMPKELLASVGYDALCHNMEGYISVIGQPITEMYAREGMRLIAEHLLPIYGGDNAPEHWEAITWASTLGGMVINCAGVGLPHGMEHPASGLKNISHGKGLAALTPVVLEESIPYAPKKYGIIARILGGEDEHTLVSALKNFQKKLGLDITLADLGFDESDVDWMTENCLKVSVGSIATHPMPADREKIREIYIKSLAGI
ncbi:iron-containing alcohol dehydrogenase [Diplocloster modestus]|uniref:Iron-containing alcohol dehydrogenase n=1 Tax=Diplocloster modestus TaxID=2850322 RepID=A0ABS6KBV1_9FIRM|nr:iron-containing alcohol dehydrogenase [Diplocloster modestus]MBU9728000.1 iron-containing alcohol dehydrogenase [Diplocloster modestus]